MNVYIMAIPARESIWREMASDLKAQGACVQVVIDQAHDGPLPNLVEHGRAPSSLGHPGARLSVYYRQRVGEDHQWDSIDRAILWRGSPIAHRAKYMRAAP